MFPCPLGQQQYRQPQDRQIQVYPVGNMIRGDQTQHQWYDHRKHGDQNMLPAADVPVDTGCRQTRPNNQREHQLCFSGTAQNRPVIYQMVVGCDDITEIPGLMPCCFSPPEAKQHQPGQDKQNPSSVTEPEQQGCKGRKDTAPEVDFPKGIHRQAKSGHQIADGADRQHKGEDGADEMMEPNLMLHPAHLQYGAAMRR